MKIEMIIERYGKIKTCLSETGRSTWCRTGVRNVSNIIQTSNSDLDAVGVHRILSMKSLIIQRETRSWPGG